MLCANVMQFQRFDRVHLSPLLTLVALDGVNLGLHYI